MFRLDIGLYTEIGSSETHKQGSIRHTYLSINWYEQTTHKYKSCPSSYPLGV